MMTTMSYSGLRANLRQTLFFPAALLAKAKIMLTAFLGAILLLALWGCAEHDDSDRPVVTDPIVTDKSIDRQALVSRHNPELNAFDPSSPFTVGNGQFAFTADVTGLQSFSDYYFNNGTPLETKARWAWHTRDNHRNYTLDDAGERFQAYGREVSFPTNMDSAAGQWLRQNPHDLPLARIALNYGDKPLAMEQVDEVSQQLDLWNGLLTSQYSINATPVRVQTVVGSEADVLAFDLRSGLVDQGQLSISF